MVRRERMADVVIVGAGWVGGIMAKELAKAGLTVVGLERGAGAEGADDNASISGHDELATRRGRTFSLSDTTVTTRNARSETARPMRLPGAWRWRTGVGGTGNYWATSSYRFSPWDFKLRSRSVERYGATALPEDCTSQDWPISYEQLEPYYDRFERDIGVSGKAGNLKGRVVEGGNPFEGPREREYPTPPSQDTHAQKIFADAAASLGYHPYPAPRATMTEAYTNPDGISLAPCGYCGHCSDYICEMNAKATPVSTVLPAALATNKFTIRTNVVVTRVNLDSTGTIATGVTYVDAGGEEVEQRASIVVLAGFTFSNVQLLLVSGIGEPYDPQTGRGHVGRNYSWHNRMPDAVLLYDGKTFNGFMGAGGLGSRISDFQGDNFDHAGLGFIGGASMGVMVGGEEALSGGSVPPGTPGFGAEWKRAVARYSNRTIRIQSLHDVLSYRGNFLDLDPTYKDRFGMPLLRVTFDNKPNEKRAVRYCGEKLSGVVQAMGANHVVIRTSLPEHFDVGNVSHGGVHQSGGAIAGGSPGDSVVNGHSQVWGTPNVFVVGGSAFPQLAGYNPTLTAGAMAYRSAEGIINRYVRSPGLID